MAPASILLSFGNSMTMNNINTVTAFEKKHFDHNSVTVQPRTINIPGVMGFDLTRDQILGLSGALSGSTVTIFVKRYWTVQEVGDEEVPAGLFFKVENATYISSHNIIGVFRDDPPGSCSLYLKLIDFITPTPSALKGLAARMLAVIVREALKLSGIKRLRLYAAGGRTWPDRDSATGERWGGYVAWPTYGFDMLLCPETIKLTSLFPYCPPKLTACTKVSEVLALKPLEREYWKVVGDGDYMDFDLSATSSASIVTLDAFLGSVGI